MIQMEERVRHNGTDFVIFVEAWSGNVRPFIGVVKRAIDGKRMLATGSCKTETRAINTARAALRRFAVASVK